MGGSDGAAAGVGSGAEHGGALISRGLADRESGRAAAVVLGDTEWTAS